MSPVTDHVSGVVVRYRLLFALFVVCLLLTYILFSVFPQRLLVVVLVLCIFIVFKLFLSCVFLLLLGYCNKLISPTGD